MRQKVFALRQLVGLLHWSMVFSYYFALPSKPIACFIFSSIDASFGNRPMTSRISLDSNPMDFNASISEVVSPVSLERSKSAVLPSLFLSSIMIFWAFFVPNRGTEVKNETS